MIHKLSLQNFRGFHQFTVMFPNPAILVGPNNAGKSTLITALRLATLMLRYAKRFNASGPRKVAGEEIRVHQFSSDQFDLQDENLRYEFRQVDTSFTLTFTNGCRLRAVWPRRPPRPFFYLQDRGGASLEVARAIRDLFPSIGTIPPLSPIDLREELLGRRWVQQNLTTKLASRHFRNQLLMLSEGGQWNDFSNFCEEWTGGLRLERPRVQEVDDQTSIDVYFHEGRGPKEVAWVGDGLQIFLQLLLHLFRLRDSNTVVLDEPEVYLHPDLQRRLLRVLESVTPQFVIATHSPEIVAEIERDKVVLVERGTDQSLRIPESAEMSRISDAIGSGFNLGLARALRSNVTLFVEGKDDAIVLRNLANIIGARRLGNEDGITFAQLHGVTNWQMLRGLPFLTDSIFGGAITGYVILDRDVMSDLERVERREELRAAGLHAHIWERRELESYLIHPEAIARLIGMDATEVRNIIEEELEALLPDMEDHVMGARIQNVRDRRLHATSTVRAAREEVKATWTSLEAKLTFCPAKSLLSRVNQRTQGLKGVNTSWNALSRHLLVEEVPEEMARVLMNIEELLETLSVEATV